MIGNDLVDRYPAAADVVSNSLFNRHAGQQARWFCIMTIGAFEDRILVHELPHHKNVLFEFFEREKLASQFKVPSDLCGCPVIRVDAIPHEEKCRSHRRLHGGSLHTRYGHRFEERQGDTGANTFEHSSSGNVPLLHRSIVIWHLQFSFQNHWSSFWTDNSSPIQSGIVRG